CSPDLQRILIPKERRAATRLEGWAEDTSSAAAERGPWFETHALGARAPHHEESCLVALSRPTHLAAVRRRDGDAGRRIFVELVAQGADRDAEDVGGMRAVAEAVLERLEDEVALDVGDRAADERARDRFGGERGVRDG